MWDSIANLFARVNWDALLSHVTNDRLIALATHPYGMAALLALLVLTVVCKWRLLFVAIAGALAISLLARHTLEGSQTGPSGNLLAFAGGGVAVAAFAIYYLFIRED